MILACRFLIETLRAGYSSFFSRCIPCYCMDPGVQDVTPFSNSKVGCTLLSWYGIFDLLFWLDYRWFQMSSFGFLSLFSRIAFPSVVFSDFVILYEPSPVWFSARQLFDSISALIQVVKRLSRRIQNAFTLAPFLILAHTLSPFLVHDHLKQFENVVVTFTQHLAPLKVAKCCPDGTTTFLNFIQTVRYNFCSSHGKCFAMSYSCYIAQGCLMMDQKLNIIVPWHLGHSRLKLLYSLIKPWGIETWTFSGSNVTWSNSLM